MPIVSCHEKPCEECGAFFTPKNSRQKFCATTCSSKVKERRRIESGYYQRPEVAERLRASQRAAYQPRTPKAFEVVPATCPHCGEGFDKTHQHKRYCTDACVEAARKARKRKPADMKLCKGCGEEFTATRTMEFCGVPCRKKHNRAIELQRNRAKPKPPRKVYEPKTYAATCVVCNEMYEARSAKSKYCTEKCRFEERAMQEGKRDCRRCSEALEDTHYARYCQPCQVLNKREARAAYRRNQSDRCRNHKERAEKYGVPYEPFKRSDIYDRDGWRCGICSSRIKQTLAYPHPMSVSLDHIVPLSRGGGHLRDNVQAAHLRCNVLKGADGAYAQPLLIG